MSVEPDGKCKNGKKLEPLVSIIVLNWNGKDCIRSCLRSLLNQTYPNYEIIVVDNASTDSSPEIVRREFPEVRLIINYRNLGFAGGNNVGVKAAGGDLIALFNNDAIADSNWLSTLVHEIHKSPNIGIVGGIIYFCEPKDLVWAAGGKIDFLTGLGWLANNEEKLRGGYSHLANDIDFVPGTALLIKKEVTEKIGPLDEDYFLYFEDLDWALTAKERGYKCKLVESAIVWHTVSFSSRMRNQLFGYYHDTRGSFHLFIKHFPLPLLLSSTFFQLIVFTILQIMLFRRLDKAKTRIQAFIWALHNIAKTAIERRQVITLTKIRKIRLLEVMKIIRKRVAARQRYWY